MEFEIFFSSQSRFTGIIGKEKKNNTFFKHTHKFLFQPHLECAFSRWGTTDFKLFEDSSVSEIATKKVSNCQGKKGIGRTSPLAEESYMPLEFVIHA